MALPSSGQITLNDVNVELGNSGTAQIGMGDAAVRGLFDIASGEIEMSDGYGKSSETVISSSVQEMTVSSYISSGGTLRISSGVYIWSDSTSTAGMIIDTPCTVINEGYIMGKGGAGGNTGGAGGPAINVTSSGVTITNSSGAFIAGGGGGGGGSQGLIGGGSGGGGAGGGTASGQSGGAIGSNGNGTGTTGGAGGAGGQVVVDREGRIFVQKRGQSGGRILPGSGGTQAGCPSGGGPGVTPSGNSYMNGGGGWGAAGGNGGGLNSGPGGAAGAAITGTSRTLTNNGTIYGST
jgi:hypothetical protein